MNEEEKLAEARFWAKIRDAIDEYLENLAPPEAKKPAPQLPAQPEPTWHEVVPLKSSEDRLLATLFVADDRLRIVPDSSLALKVTTPPFQSFLIDRILNAMKRKDETSGIKPSLSWKVEQEGDVIRELIVYGYHDVSRVKELKTSARWCFEKMSEKTS